MAEDLDLDAIERDHRGPGVGDEDISRLLAEVRALRAERDGLRAELEQWREYQRTLPVMR